MFAGALCGAAMSFGPAAAAAGTATPLVATVADVNVSGTVLDSSGEPLQGATVREKGRPTNGCLTDLHGRYNLKVKKGAKLEITYVGCTAATINAGTNVTTIMQDDSKLLDDVVVVGFGTQKKANLTGAVAVASGEELASRPVKNATEALQGMLPGLQLTHNAGDIETNMSIAVRGLGTIGEGSSGAPLVIIDGMEADINTVAPQDIENVTVLKDAAASSIYGSRAAFGVVMVTTKKGSQGNARVNYTNNFRWNNPIGLPTMMNSVDFALYQNLASRNSGYLNFFSDETINNMIRFQEEGGTNRGGILKRNANEWGDPNGYHAFNVAYANTDWLHELYKQSFSQEHNASVSGGNNIFNYYASLGFNDINGMLNHGKDNRKRYNAAAKFSAQLNKWVRFNYAMRYVHTDTSVPSRFGSGWYSVIGAQTWPNLPIYDENGYYYNCDGSTPAMSLAQGGVRGSAREEMYQQAGLLIEPIKKWFIHVDFNYSRDNTETKTTYLPFYNHYVDGTLADMRLSSSMGESYYRDAYMNWNIFSDYTFDINEAHNFKVMAGMQSEKNNQKTFSASAYGMLDYDHPELSLTNNLQGDGKEKAPTVSGSSNEWAILGFFGRLNYDYKGRYLFEANARLDGSSRFRRGSRWTWSPSASLGWNIAQEDFWEDFRGVSNMLKLRLSAGQLSNQNTYSWYPTYRTMNIGIQNGSWLQNNKRPNTSWVGDLVSTSLTWEQVRTYNVGLDWGFFNNRLTGSFDAFIRDTKGMVGPPVEVPNILGLGAPQYNNCSLRTHGWELQIGWRDVTSFGLSYGISANVSDAMSKVTEYPGNPTGNLSQYLPGHYLNEIWGQETIGIAKTDEEMQQHLATTQQWWYGNNWTAGDIMYKDMDGDGIITWGDWNVSNPGDMHVIGNTTPRYMFGLDINLAYKGFDFRAFFQGVGKRDFYSRSKTFWGTVSGGVWSTAGLQEHLDFFRAEDEVFAYKDKNGVDRTWVLPANTDSYYPRPLFDWKNQEYQTRYLLDASYLRCKNMQFGYTFPNKWTNVIGMNNLRVYVSADNLFTLTKLTKLFDPETMDGGSWDDRTYAGNSYPLARTWSFGLSVSL